jgi:hypothetical protein
MERYGSTVIIGILLGTSAWAQQANAPVAPRHHYPGELGSEYRHYFVALGNRMQTTGKERLVLTGTLEQATRNTAASSVRITIDIAGQLRMDSTGGPSVTVVYDGQQIKNSGAGQGKADQDLADSLSQDSMESVITGLIQGNAARTIASHARWADPRSPSTPILCDVVQQYDRSSASWRDPEQAKTYCFDSTTHLLAAVMYRTPSKANVITRFSDWRSIENQGQMVPFKVERLENGNAVFTLTVQKAELQAHADDGFFNTH